MRSSLLLIAVSGGVRCEGFLGYKRDVGPFLTPRVDARIVWLTPPEAQEQNGAYGRAARVHLPKRL